MLGTRHLQGLEFFKLLQTIYTRRIIQNFLSCWLINNFIIRYTYKCTNLSHIPFTKLKSTLKHGNKREVFQAILIRFSKCNFFSIDRSWVQIPPSTTHTIFLFLKKNKFLLSSIVNRSTYRWPSALVFHTIPNIKILYKDQVLCTDKENFHMWNVPLLVIKKLLHLLKFLSKTSFQWSPFTTMVSLYSLYSQENSIHVSLPPTFGFKSQLW